MEKDQYVPISTDGCYDLFLIAAYILYIFHCNDFDVSKMFFFVSNEVFHKDAEGVLLNEIYRAIQCVADVSRMFPSFLFTIIQPDLVRSGPDLMITTMACWMVNGWWQWFKMPQRLIVNEVIHLFNNYYNNQNI